MIAPGKASACNVAVCILSRLGSVLPSVLKLLSLFASAFIILLLMLC